MDKLKMCFLEVKENECDQKKCPAVNNSQGEVGCSNQQEWSCLQSSEQYKHRVPLIILLLDHSSKE